ncbi:MAG: RNA methyltransferase [Ignavibacteriae bacterium]|nr:RNA methyltransferase [Ignavibacteriota bacterium]
MNNEELKNIAKLKQKKFRDESGQFLIEGAHLIDECNKSKYYKRNIIKIILRTDFKDERLLGRLRHIESEYLSPKDFNKISETENPQGIIAVTGKADNLPHHEGKIICALDNINDPGNLGTILRTCWWFGIENVITGRDSVEVFNSKVIRASQGAVFNLLIKEKVNLKEELIGKSNEGYTVLLTDLSAINSISNTTFGKDKKYVIVFGNEANGISKGIKEIPEFEKIKIDSYTKCESLNVASSAAIILHEIIKGTN